ncbi:hypothetical protein AAF712_005606 [Marasmius tenuissimus]|uniref:CoA-binding domain-containing protein n=1 Tax=Marasmius tenuissimus TaxID=585030 RepID=A0ABR3A166_9AGAR
MAARSQALRLQKAFLSNSYFAVAGASKVQSKFGTKVLKWYLNRELKVQPVHPKEPQLEGIETIRSVETLPSPTSTSLSIITPPSVTLGILKQVKQLGIPYVWLQPGAEDAEVVQFIKENDMENTAIYGGPCVLRDGDGIRHAD